MNNWFDLKWDDICLGYVDPAIFDIRTSWPNYLKQFKLVQKLTLICLKCGKKPLRIPSYFLGKKESNKYWQFMREKIKE